MGSNMPLIETILDVVTREHIAREILSKDLGNSAKEPDETRKLIDKVLGEARGTVGRNTLYLTYQIEAMKFLLSDEAKEDRVVGVVPSTESSLQEKVRPETHKVIKFLKKARPSKVFGYLWKGRQNHK